MERRNFIKNAATIAAAGSVGILAGQNETFANSLPKAQKGKARTPRAITMWDFSWLERRWPGAGYENWDKVLDELVGRGYNAVRIDAYPHLVAANPEKRWTLIEVWNQQVWGSPDVNQVVVQSSLNQFIAKCKERDIKVGLSTWFREDVDKTRMKIASAEKHAEIWIKTLKTIEKDGLIDNILYVDLCNEWPGDLWAPFFKNDPPELTWGYWHTDASMKWMKTAIELVRKEFPQLPFNFSFDNLDVEKYAEKDLSFFDFAEHHIWMTKENGGEFYKKVDYNYDRFSPQAYKNVVKNAEPLYRSNPEYWKKLLADKIQLTAKCAARAKLPLITTECWGIVDYKDWPLLNWDWIKELCELGTITAASTGQWGAIATSNFCGPQFAGMWRDVEYHQRLTSIIKKSVINEELNHTKLVGRL